MNISQNPPDSTGAENFDALRAQIRERFDGFSPHLQRIARAALDQPNYFAFNTIVVIAEELRVQPSTIIRFAKELGYKGFTELQQVFRLRLIEGGPDNREQIYERKAAAGTPADMHSVMNGCVDALIGSLESARRNISAEDLTKAMTMIREASHIHVAGLRRSKPIASYLAYGLLRTEIHCDLLDFGGGLAEQQVANMRPRDLLVCVGFTPYAPAVVDIVRDANLRRRSVIAITDTPDSPLAKNATLTFYVDNEVSGHFRPISGAIALVQSLIVGLSE